MKDENARTKRLSEAEELDQVRSEREVIENIVSLDKGNEEAIAVRDLALRFCLRNEIHVGDHLSDRVHHEV